MSFMSDFLAKGFPKNIGVPDFPVISLIYYEQVPDAEKVSITLSAKTGKKKI